MTDFAHTPYDGSRKPFSIGLQPVDLADWFLPDRLLVAYLDEKEDLIAHRPEAVWREEIETRAAQREVADLVAAHLVEIHPGLYRRAGEGVAVLPADRVVDLSDAAGPPLLQVSRLVQEDLCLMRKGAGGYRLAAASLCFPSSWSLAEKFGKTLDGLHEPVPHYAEQLAARMNRIFDSLRVGFPVWRMNWALNPDPELHHPESKNGPRDRAWTAGPDVVAARTFIRVERQTLRRLPESGDILFTIKIEIDPLTALVRHPDGAALADSLKGQILALDESQLAYKALTQHRDRVVAALDAVAAGTRKAGEAPAEV